LAIRANGFSMLVTVLIWLYIGILAYLYGYLGIEIAQRITRIEPPQIFPFSLVAIVGLCLITTLTGFLSIFISIGLAANILLILGAGLILWFFRKGLPGSLLNGLARIRQSNPLIWILLVALIIVTLVKTTELAHNYDTGLYHAQTIRWMETYPIVPGLGNLHSRLAFNSSWFLPSTLFSLGFLGAQSFHVINGFFYLLVITYGLSKFARLLNGELYLSNIMAVLTVFLARFLFSLELSSPGTDMPTALLIWVVFLLGMEKIERGESSHFNVDSILILILAIWSVTLKLSAAPILLLPIYFSICEFRKNPRMHLAFLVLLAGMILLPWLVRNIILSGYLLFPVSTTEVNFLDWRLPQESVLEAEQSITAWSRIPGVDRNIVLKMPYKEWVPIWYGALERQDRLLLYAILISVICIMGYCLYVLVRSRQSLRRGGRYLFLYVVAILGVIFWFMQAPSMRFGYGFLGILFFLLAAPLIKVFLDANQTWRRLLLYAVLVGMLVYQGGSLYRMKDISQFKDRWILPLDYPIVETTTEMLGGFSVSIPTSSDQCWYAQLSCTPINNPNVHMRGPSLSDGFYDIRTQQR
jgi:hypothetical protein